MSLDTPGAILRALMTNPAISLGDLVYTVRERSGGDWEAPNVKAWSDAVSAADKWLKDNP